jgi:hypothetical protein
MGAAAKDAAAATSVAMTAATTLRPSFLTAISVRGTS